MANTMKRRNVQNPKDFSCFDKQKNKKTTCRGANNINNKIILIICVFDVNSRKTAIPQQYLLSLLLL